MVSFQALLARRALWSTLVLGCVGGCSVYDLDTVGGSGGASGGARAATLGSGVGGAASGGAGASNGGHAGSGTAGNVGGAGAAGSSSTSGRASGNGGGSGSSASSGAGGSSGNGGAAGSGGSSGPGGALGSGGSSGPGGAAGTGGAPALDLIDDLEDDDAVVRTISMPVRDGVWDTSNDMSPGGTQVPPPSMFQPIALGADVPYAGDKYAAYTRGSGFTSYGAFMNVSMRSWPTYATTPTYDASAYLGLSFWAKVDRASTRSVRVRFISADTDPRGGKCLTSGPTDQRCYNHFYEDVALTTSWALYQIRFSDFVQGNSGEIFPAINVAQMYGLEFYFLSGARFEVWIDDLSFIKR